jgi:hypothetical protein
MDTDRTEKKFLGMSSKGSLYLLKTLLKITVMKNKALSEAFVTVNTELDYVPFD